MSHQNCRRVFLLTLATVLALTSWMRPTVADQTNAAPLEEVKVAAHMKLVEGDGKLLRVAGDIYRVEVISPKVCFASIITPRELSLIGVNPGHTDVTFWCKDETQKPTKIHVTVVPKVKGGR